MDTLEETIESIANNFINSNLSDCKRQLQELGKEYPMALAYVTLKVYEQLWGRGEDFIRWISKNIEEVNPKNYQFLYYGWIWEAPFTLAEWEENQCPVQCDIPEGGTHYIYPFEWYTSPSQTHKEPRTFKRIMNPSFKPLPKAKLIR